MVEQRHQEVSDKCHFPPLAMLERGQRTGLGLPLREGRACMTTCYPGLSWEYWDKRLQGLKYLGLQLPSWLSRPGQTSAQSMLDPARPIQAHVAGEGEAGVMPAAHLDTCSVLFVNGQVSLAGWLYQVRLRSVLLPKTVPSLCFLSLVKGEIESKGRGRSLLGGNPGTQEPLGKNNKRTI